MSCSIVSSLASSKMPSAYLTMRITCPILKCPHPFRTSLVRYSLYKGNRIGDKPHRFLTSLLNFTLLVSACSSFSLKANLQNLLINLLSRQSIPVCYRIYTKVLQCSLCNALYRCIKQAQSLSSSDIILNIPVVSPGSFSSTTSKRIFSQHVYKFPFNPSSV